MSDEQQQQQQPLGYLPSPDDVQQQSKETIQEDNVTKITLNETTKLDVLGPVVVNVDGSLGRITNWFELTDHERKIFLKKVVKRNNERLQALRNQQQ